MKRFGLLAIGVLAVALSGCSQTANLAGAISSIATATVSPQAASASEYAFDGAETIATGYLRLPLCGSSGASAACRNTPASKALLKPLKAGQIARDQLDGLLHANNGGAIPVAALDTLNAATSALQSIEATYSLTAK